MRAVISLLLLLVLAQTAHGASRVQAFINGNELREACQVQDPICAGYIVGVADAIEMVALHLTNVCRPSTVNAEEVGEVLLKWLEEHPEELDRPAAKLAGIAFAEAWPCNK